MKIIAMVPARMGSKRLPHKNLRTFQGVPLVTHALRRCHASAVFDEVWLNTEAPDLKKIAEQENALFHQRPDELANDHATSEQYIAQFLQARTCDFLFQVHSIAPLLEPETIGAFVRDMRQTDMDVLLGCVHEQIEYLYADAPVNFSFEEKTNSQELKPLQRLTWAITGWRRATYLEAVRTQRCATYAGKVGTFEIDKSEGHIIKTEQDLQFAEALAG